MLPILDHAAPGHGDELFERLVDAVVIQDPSGRIVRWNRAALAIFGLSDVEIEGRNSIDPRWRAVHPDGSPWPGDTHPPMIVLHSGDAVTDEVMGIRRPDDRLVWLRVCSYPLLADGELRGVASTYQDITEIHDRATDQESSQRRFRTAFQRSPVGQLIVGPDGSVLDTNGALCELLGRSHEEVLQLDAYAFTSMQISDELAGALLAPHRGDAVPMTYDFRRPSGAVRRGLTQLCGIDWPGADNCLLVQIVDVTELEQSRTDLQRALGRSEASFRNSPIGLAHLSLDGRILSANPAMGRLTGLAPDELEGRDVRTVLHPDDVASTLRFAERATEDGAVVVEHRIRRSDGEVRWLQTHLTLLVTDDGHALLAQALDHTTHRRQQVKRRGVDPLTGLLNREGLVDAFEEQIFTGRVHAGRRVVVMTVDLDDFDGVNDRLGALGADQLLRRVGAAIRAALPPDADVARLRADTFASVAPAADEREAKRLAERVMALVSEAGADDEGRLRLRIAVRPVDELDTSPAELVQAAEDAVHTVERGDGARIRVVGGDEARGAGSTGAAPDWSSTIEAALSEHRFLIIAEPITDLVYVEDATPRRRYELLTRLALPGRDPVPMPKFERFAQRMGLIGAIDRNVAEHAVRLLAADPDLEFELNVAPSTMADLDYLDELGGHLDAAGVESGRVLLALRERYALDDMDAAIAFGDRARRLGLRVMLDDYGALEDNPVILETLGIERVKLTTELTVSAKHNESRRLRIEALATSAAELGIEVAASFVNDIKALDTLRRAGVRLAQGRLVGTPTLASDLAPPRAA